MPLRATAGVALLLALLALAAPVATATTSIVSQPAAGSPGSNASDATRDVATASENVTVENLTVWTAPGSIRDRLDDREAIATARRTGNLTRDGTVARSDALVLSMRIPGLAARMDNVTGANETVRFIRATNGTDSSVRLVQTNPTTEVPEKIVGLHRSGAMTVVADQANDTYHLVVDLTESRVGFRDYGESISPDGVDWNPRMDPNVRRGELFAVNVTIDGHTSLFDTDRDSSRPDAVVHVVGVDAEFGATDALDVLVLQATTGQPVRARTSLAPGTPVVVRIENRSDGGPAIVRRTHVVETTTGGVGDDRFEPVTHEILAPVDTSGGAPITPFANSVRNRTCPPDRRPAVGPRPPDGRQRHAVRDRELARRPCQRHQRHALGGWVPRRAGRRPTDPLRPRRHPLPRARPRRPGHAPERHHPGRDVGYLQTVGTASRVRDRRGRPGRERERGVRRGRPALRREQYGRDRRGQRPGPPTGTRRRPRGDGYRHADADVLPAEHHVTRRPLDDCRGSHGGDANDKNLGDDGDAADYPDARDDRRDRRRLRRGAGGTGSRRDDPAGAAAEGASASARVTVTRRRRRPGG
jgi:hypothetical protein